MELKRVGYFSKTHGVKGQLILRLEQDLFADELKAVFVESATGQAPYFISELKQNNGGLVLSLEDVSSVEQARLLLGKAVFADATLLDEADEEPDWTGFELIDKHFGVLGAISGVSDNGQQVLLSVEHKGKEVILPLVEEFIEKVDEENKKLYFNAPEGLIELYLEEQGS